MSKTKKLSLILAPFLTMWVAAFLAHLLPIFQNPQFMHWYEIPWFITLFFITASGLVWTLNHFDP